MPEIKISEMTEVTPAEIADLVAVVDVSTGLTKRMTLGTLLAAARTIVETLTGKTISLDDNTLNATSGANGDVIKHDGTKFSRLARGAANTIFKANSAGNNTEFGLLANANVANDAAVAVSKFAAGTNGQALRTFGGVPTWGSERSADQAVADADIPALDAAVVECGIIRFTGALTATRTVVFPHAATAAASYVRLVGSACTGRNLVISTGTGTTVSLPPSGYALLKFTPDGVDHVTNTAPFIQFDGNSGDPRALAGKMRLTPYTTDIIACRDNNNAADRVALSQWHVSSNVHELWLGQGQIALVPYDRVVLAAKEFVRCLIDSSTEAWRSTVNGTEFKRALYSTVRSITALNINWAEGNVFTKTLAAGANTFTFSNVAAGQTIIVRVTSDPGGSTLAFPTVKWPGGVVPTQTSAGTDVYTFVNDGTDTYGSVVQAMA